MKPLKLLSFAIFLAFSASLHAQVYSKITVDYSTNKALEPVGYFTGLFGKSREIWVIPEFKIRGKDSPYVGDVSIDAKLLDKSVKLNMIHSIEIPDSFHITFCGHFTARDYALSEDEKSKKLISRKTGNNEFQLLKVHTDDEHRKYVEMIYTNGCTTIPDELIDYVKVYNHEFWVLSEEEKELRIREYKNHRNAGLLTRVTLVTGGMVALILLFRER